MSSKCLCATVPVSPVYITISPPYVIELFLLPRKLIYSRASYVLPLFIIVYLFSPNCLPFLSVFPSVPLLGVGVVEGIILKRPASIYSESSRSTKVERESDRAKWPFVVPRVCFVGVCGCSLSRAFTMIRAFELTIHLRTPFFLSLSLFFLLTLSFCRTFKIPLSLHPLSSYSLTCTLSGYITCSCNAVKLS